ncbi:MAG: PQQ-binding-like beta-propeller repeat protein [Thermoguttaceae bacterium]
MRKPVREAVRLIAISGCLTLLLSVLAGCGSEKPDAAFPAVIDDLPVVTAAAEDWPWWRGPMRDNVAAADQDPPLVWSETENVLWQADLPGSGHATPCIHGDRIFLASADKEQETIWINCFDRDSGDPLWQTVVYSGPMAKIHGDNSYASATAACDGERVFFPYQTDREVRMTAVDLDGTVVWDEAVTTFGSIQGYSASPVLYKSALIVSTDGTKANKVTALHRGTGQVVWQILRPEDDESYASPLVAHVAGRDQLVIIGPNKTRAYDPNSGELFWECDGPAKYTTATIAFDSEKIYATGGYPQKALLAIRADGSGDVTDTHLAWKSDKKAGYVPSPLLGDGLIYAVADRGLMRCYDAASGQVVWEEDLNAPFYSSPVLVGDRVYLFDRKGKGYVFKAGREFELLAENSLPDGVFATPVICGSRIYLRTLGDFYCLGTP